MTKKTTRKTVSKEKPKKDSADIWIKDEFSFECPACLYYGNDKGEKPFITTDGGSYLDHMQESHQIKAPKEMTALRETTAYSKYLQHLLGSEPPMVFEFANKDGTKNRTYLPLLDIPAPTKEAPTFFEMNAQMGDKRVHIRISALLVDTDEYKVYSIPEMISQECAECPHCFNKEDRKIDNQIPVLDQGFKISQESIMTFSCDIDLCPAIKKFYSEHLILWSPKLMDDCLAPLPEEKDSFEKVEK